MEADGCENPGEAAASLEDPEEVTSPSAEGERICERPINDPFHNLSHGVRECMIEAPLQGEGQQRGAVQPPACATALTRPFLSTPPLRP